jgi:hypothetical protein
MDVDDSPTADPVEIKPVSQKENEEAVGGNEASVVDLVDAAFDKDLAVDTGVKEDSDDFECNETATETLKETPVGDVDALVSDDEPGSVPVNDFGDFSTTDVTHENADSEKATVSDNDTPFEEANTSDSDQDGSPDDDVGYFSAVDAITSTGFEEVSNAENDEALNNGVTDDTMEEGVPESEPDTLDDNFGDFSGAGANVHSKESGNNEDSEGSSEPLQDDAFSSFSAEPIGDGKEFLTDATENDESAVLPKKGTESGVILDDNEQIDLKRTDHAIEDERQVDSAQTTSEALPADAVDGQGDDFEDFGTFNQAAPSESQSAVTPLTSVDQQAHLDADDDDDDDDFGDFGSFEQAEDVNQSSQVERVEKQEQTVVLEQAGQDDDDDDFGDFGDFADFATDQASQDVGEQGAADDTSPVTRSVGDESSGPESRSFAQAFTTGIVDPVIQKAESVFQDVFGPAVEGGDAVEDDCDASPRVIVSVQSVLVSTILSIPHQLTNQ